MWDIHRTGVEGGTETRIVTALSCSCEAEWIWMWGDIRMLIKQATKILINKKTIMKANNFVK